MIQCGTFYETYQDPFSEKGKAKELSRVLNIRLTRKKTKKTLSKTDPYMSGIPICSYVEHVSLLKSKGYTIVLIDQDPKNKKKREISSIISPGVDVDFVRDDTNYVVSLYFIVDDRNYPYPTICGLSSIDVTTGQNSASQVQHERDNNHNALHEAYRFILSHKPKEILIYVKGTGDVKKFEKIIIKELKLETYENLHIEYDYPKEYDNIDYQDNYINKVFPDVKTQLPLFEELGLALMTQAILSYILLLRFCFDRNSNILKNIRLPKVDYFHSDKHLGLTHNSIEQLDIIGETRSLFGIIDKTKTNMGKRELKNRLLNPLKDSLQLESSYNAIESFTDIDLSKIRLMLGSICDVERYYRKITLNKISSYELYNFINSMIIFPKIYNMVKKIKEFKLTREEKIIYKETIEYLKNNINVKRLKTAHIDNRKKLITFDGEIKNFLPNSEKTKKLQNLLCRYTEEIKKIGQKLSNKIEFSHAKNKVDYYVCLLTTEYRFKSFSKEVSFSKKFRTIKTLKNKVIVTSDVLEELYLKVTKIALDFQEVIYEELILILECIKSNRNIFEKIISLISKIDITQCFSYISTKYAYFRPSIEKRDSGYSFVNIKDMRHPIVERLRTDVPYVTNDVFFDSKKSYTGMLLYGVNTCGKTTYAKAVGLCILLAQMGCFVPGKMTYYPYNKIVTRLTGTDSLIEGKSSFMIEMAEIRTMIDNASPNTLVLGDELCRGTDEVSGHQITIAVIQYLIENKTNFVFATHMHRLPRNKYIKRLSEGEMKSPLLSIKHMKAYYDDKMRVMIYDRKLVQGSGKSVYGLEIAKYLGLNKEIIDFAKSITIEYESIEDKTDFVRRKRSNYNSKVFVDVCEICGKKGEETHHNVEQSKADKNGICEYFHKNSKFNITITCWNCHHKYIHSKGKKLKKIMTSEGPKLIFEK